MSVITVNQIIDNIDSFINNVKKLSKSYFIAVGRPDPWTDDNEPPTANASVEQTELSIYRDLVYGKLIADTDVSYMIRRIPWANNTVYSQYSQNDADLLTKDFYVVTDAAEIYKCIYNNANAASVVKPSLNTTTDTFKTSDGYIWKYMFTIDAAANTKFSTITYIPLTVNNDVQTYSTPGTIDYIALTNKGNNYQVYDAGFLQNVANNGYVVVLSNTSVNIDDYYTGSSIYLKAGGGAGQIRNIIDYTGLDKKVLVDSPFDVYVNLNLSSNTQTVVVGDTITQNSVDLSYLYSKGTFATGATLVQSDTGFTGTIVLANSSHFIITSNNGSVASIDLPVYNTTSGGVLKSGNVTVITGNNYVIANTGTSFTTNYAINDYINVGTSANSQIRRITSVNSTVIIVDANTPFTSNLTSVVHYSVPSAITPSSISPINRIGTVSYVNINGQSVNISNTTPSGAVFIPGEKVKQVDVDNVDQGANAVISFSNSSSIELSSVAGTITTGKYLLGQSSNTRTYISSVTSFPNISLSNPIGTFTPGLPISVNGLLSNVTVLSTSITPSSLTEYIVSPKVTITGDGSDALAYAYVDTSGNNPTRQISEIVMINHGTGYTTANVTISSNGSFGSNATAEAAISPILGHGANAYMELGSKYAGISVTFSNGNIESYKYPITGDFRKIMILEDPTFNDATLTLNSFDRVKLYLGTTNGINFIPGEIAYQSNTSKAGIVVYSNSSYLELKNVSNTSTGLPFIATATNDSNTSIIGLASNAHANVLISAANNSANSTVAYFTISNSVESVSEITSGATAVISQTISNTSVRLTDIKGHFNANDTLFDASTNAYANVVSITMANGMIDATTNFGRQFIQICRIPLSSNTGTFVQYETVTQAATNASGTVLTFNNDRDIVISSNAVAVNNGDLLNSTSGGTAIALYSNGVYVKCTGSNGTFIVGDTLKKGNTTIGTISNVYPVLNLYDVYNTFSVGNNYISGSISQANGLCTIPNTIWQPELVRNSGMTSYIENIMPFTRSTTSSEKINIIIKF
jgi:hypothetical protein